MPVPRMFLGTMTVVAILVCAYFGLNRGSKKWIPSPSSEQTTMPADGSLSSHYSLQELMGGLRNERISPRTLERMLSGGELSPTPREVDCLLEAAKNGKDTFIAAIVSRHCKQTDRFMSVMEGLHLEDHDRMWLWVVCGTEQSLARAEGLAKKSDENMENFIISLGYPSSLRGSALLSEIFKGRYCNPGVPGMCKLFKRSAAASLLAYGDEDAANWVISEIDADRSSEMAQLVTLRLNGGQNVSLKLQKPLIGCMLRHDLYSGLVSLAVREHSLEAVIGCVEHDSMVSEQDKAKLIDLFKPHLDPLRESRRFNDTTNWSDVLDAEERNIHAVCPFRGKTFKELQAYLSTAPLLSLGWNEELGCFGLQDGLTSRPASTKR